MTGWSANDWFCLSFWASVLALVVLFDTVLAPLFGFRTVSATTYQWCCRWPWVSGTLFFGGLLLYWHLAWDCWPICGD